MAVYLALGSNIGNRQANIAFALRLLAPLVRVDTVSSIYESPPLGLQDQPSYYNAACRVTTGLTPGGLLQHVKRIEREIGRRPARHWGPRPIDIDLATFDDVILETEELTVPHPGLLARAFVLAPLVELDPDLVDPRSGQRLAGVLAKLDVRDVRVVAPPPAVVSFSP